MQIGKRGIDYIGVGVGAVILNPRNEVFLARRGEKAKNERGLWECPGGSVEFGETMAAALRREMREEYGIEIKVGELLDVVDHILPEEGQHWVSPSFLCQIIAGEPQIMEPEKCSQIGWFSLNALPEHITLASKNSLATLKERVK